MWVRSLESNAGGIVGASGSGYAIRADLHRRPIRADLSRDFAAALTARLHGFRAVSVNDALCQVPRTRSLAAEYRRKTRTISRGMATLLENRALLNPLRHGAFAWKLFSHKVCRWLVPIMMLPAALGLMLLAPSHAWALALVGVGAVVIGLATLGVLWPAARPMPATLSALAFGLAANAAVVHAAWRLARNRDDSRWEPTRREPVVQLHGSGS
jgi:hypothetical protein